MTLVDNMFKINQMYQTAKDQTWSTFFLHFGKNYYQYLININKNYILLN